VEEQQINQPSTCKDERVNPREESVPGLKRTLQPIDLTSLNE
jgi:hypothetical protein